LAIYPDRAELKQEFPELEDADIQQALPYTSTFLADRMIKLPPSYATVACSRLTKAGSYFTSKTTTKKADGFRHPPSC